MDVSNGTGEGTDYRTGSGTTKIADPEIQKKDKNWTHLPDKSPRHCADPKAPWTIWFRMKNGEILGARYNHPMATVTLVKTKNGYQINAVEKTADKPAKKPAKVVKAVKSAKVAKALKSTKAVKTAKKNAA